MQTPSLRTRPAAAAALRLRAPVPTALAYCVALAWCGLPLSVLAQAPDAAPPASAWDAPPALRTSPLLQEKIPEAVRPQLPVFVTGDRISGQTDLNAVIEGNAELRRGDTVIRADRLDYNVPEDLAKANGKVRINRAGNVYEGTALELRVDAFEGFFSDARYQFLATQAHGDATRVDFIDRYRAVVHNATYTTCERGNEASWQPDWVLRAATIRIDNDRAMAMRTVAGHYQSLFSRDPATAGLREAYAMRNDTVPDAASATSAMANAARFWAASVMICGATAQSRVRSRTRGSTPRTVGRATLNVG